MPFNSTAAHFNEAVKMGLFLIGGHSPEAAERAKLAAEQRSTGLAPHSQAAQAKAIRLQREEAEKAAKEAEEEERKLAKHDAKQEQAKPHTGTAQHTPSKPEPMSATAKPELTKEDQKAQQAQLRDASILLRYDVLRWEGDTNLAAAATAILAGVAAGQANGAAAAPDKAKAADCAEAMASAPPTLQIISG